MFRKPDRILMKPLSQLLQYLFLPCKMTHTILLRSDEIRSTCLREAASAKAGESPACQRTCSAGRRNTKPF
jgi:hypothetical protein